MSARRLVALEPDKRAHWAKRYSQLYATGSGEKILLKSREKRCPVPNIGEFRGRCSLGAESSEREKMGPNHKAIVVRKLKRKVALARK